MPPEDPIFTTNPPEAGKPSPGPNGGTPPPAQAQPSGGGGENPSAGVGNLDEKIQAALGPLTKTVKNLEGFMGQLSETLQGGGGNPPNPSGNSGGGGEGGDWFDQFTQGPRESVVKVFNEEAGPLVSQLARAQTSLHLREIQGEIDRKWGDGAYHDLIEENLQGIVEKTLRQNPGLLLGKDALQITVDGLVGRSVDALASHKEKADNLQRETREKEAVESVTAALQKQGIDPTSLSGGIRRVSPVSEKLPPEAQEYLVGQLKEAGRHIDERRLALMRGIGGTYEEWKAADEKLKGGG